MKRAFEEKLQAERSRRDRFGEVRPVVHADHQGFRVVGIGNQIHFSKNWRTFPDFLQDDIKRVLGPDWGKGEIAKPFDERHEIMKWYDLMCRFQQKQPRSPDGLFGVIPNGPMRAYLLLAYDLFTLRNHQALLDSVVRRLKHRDQFQGARHELFAAATCIRAGYTIEHEDETDNSRKHTELIANHRASGQKIAVEAKSRHRPGVLGRPGQRESPETLRAGLAGLVRDAFAKPVTHPYVVFFDLNLPPVDRRILDTRWFREIADSVIDPAARRGGGDPFVLVVLSNQPHHYRPDDGPAPSGEVYSMLGRNPRLPATNPAAIAAIHDAASKFGDIPNWFDEVG